MWAILFAVIALIPVGRAAEWDQRYDRATAVALIGTAPAGFLSVAGVTSTSILLVPLDRRSAALSGGAETLGKVAAISAPVTLAGTGALGIGSLVARGVLVGEGASVDAWGGAASLGLLGAGIALGGWGLDRESVPLLAAASWTTVGAQVAGNLQLAANYRARATLVDPTGQERYDRGRLLYRWGLATSGLGVVGIGGGIGLMYLYVHTVEEAGNKLAKVLAAVLLLPVAAIGAAGCVAGVGMLTLGPGLMASGSVRAARALDEAGASPSTVAGWVSGSLLVASAPVLSTAIVAERPALYAVTGGLWLGAIGLALVQMEQDRRAWRDVEADGPEVWLQLPVVSTSF